LILIKQVSDFIQGKIGNMEASLYVKWRSPLAVHTQYGADTDQGKAVRGI
jgi:hypothetical protein